MKRIKWIWITVFFIACGGLEEQPWLPVASPESADLDSGILNELSDRIEAGYYGEVHSLLIIRHGQLVTENYYRGYGASNKHPMYSVTKSVTSALIGIAIDKGLINDLNQPLLSFFPQYSQIQNMSSNKQSVKLSDVLSMRAGFSWNELSISYYDPSNNFNQMANSSDWCKFVLDRPMSDPPGSRFVYNTGASVLLSGVLENATGQSAESFARETLFDALNITDYKWTEAAMGITNTGAGLYLTPRDMAKIGYLYLQKGMWQGVPIISSHWIDTSTTLHAVLTYPFGYGYQWWMTAADSLKNHSPTRQDIKIAWGFADQFIFVIPKLDMVVVSTGGNYDESHDDQAIIFLQQYILKAVKD
ncbi:beta-lactamase family protein [bacterium]|nr:beta-lactamase family protein [bacterium]